MKVLRIVRGAGAWIALALPPASALAGLPPADDAKSRSSAPQAAAWRFVLPAPGDPFEHAPFRALALSREKPEGLFEKASYRGDAARRRYAQIRFGSPGSTRVAVVLDEVGPGEADLFVDADRNRKIEEKDRVMSAAAGTRDRGERVWRLPLDVMMVSKDVTHAIPRAVAFRLGPGGRTLGYAAAGYLEGTITLPDHNHATFSNGGTPSNQHTSGTVRTVAVRRVDGDGNGLVANAQDRLWIDRNGDGRFDPAAEQFLFTTVLNLDGSRYVVRSDELGSRLALEPLVGVGTLRLAMKADSAKGAQLLATALGSDGSVYGLSASEPATVPVGTYRLGTVTIALDDPRGGQRWSFIFSYDGSRRDLVWYKIEKDGTVTIDPLGTPRFEISLTDTVQAAKPGEDIRLEPLLHTGDGLLINAAYRGAPISPGLQESLGARITLASTDGQVLSTAHSGFA